MPAPPPPRNRTGGTQAPAPKPTSSRRRGGQRDPEGSRKPKPQPTKGELVRGKSKKHGGAEWFYRRNANGGLEPVRPVGKPKSKGGGKKKAKSSTGGTQAPAQDTRPFGDYTDEINRGADDQFRGAETELAGAEGVATRHAADLQTVYDKFKGQLMGQQQAMQAQQAATMAQQNASVQGAVQGLGQAVGAGAQAVGNVAERTGGPDYSADVAQIGAAGAAGANAVAQPASAAIQAQGNSDQAFMGQLASIMDMEREQQAGKASQGIQAVKADRAKLASEKAASKTKRYDDLTARDAAAKQQEIENTLAEAAITADSEKARMQYRQELIKLKHDTRTQRERNATATDVAGIGADSRKDVAKTGAAATRDAARTGAESREKVAGIAAQARRDAATISAKGSGKGKGGVDVKRPDGSTVHLTEADRKKWWDRRRKTIDAHTALRRQIGQQGDEGKAINEVVRNTGLPRNVVGALVNAAHHKPATEAQRRALATFFPGGVIPPGYITGKVN